MNRVKLCESCPTFTLNDVCPVCGEITFALHTTDIPRTLRKPGFGKGWLLKLAELLQHEIKLLEK